MTLLILLVVLVLMVGGGWWGWPLVAALFGVKTVTDKPGALAKITELMRIYEISAAEVSAAHQNPALIAGATAPRSSAEIGRTLFIYLGAIFIVAGISTYLGMFWGRMGSVMRIAVTLGIGYTMLIVLISAMQEKKFPRLIMPLSLATVVMLTSGWFVFIHEVFSGGGNWRLAAICVFGVMVLHQGMLALRYARTVHVFTGLVFAYAFLQVGMDMLDVPPGWAAIALGSSLVLVSNGLEKTPHRSLADIGLLIAFSWLNAGIFDRIGMATSANWAALVTGVSVMSAALGLQKGARQGYLSALAYLVGSTLAYAGLFDLVQKTRLELLFFAVTASMLYASVQMQSRALLLSTVIAMLSFIGYFTAQHFVDSLGWPVSLIVMGVAFMGVGALAMRLKRQI